MQGAGHVMMEAEMGGRRPQAEAPRGSLAAPEVGGARRVLVCGFQSECALPTPWFWDPSSRPAREPTSLKYHSV